MYIPIYIFYHLTEDMEEGSGKSTWFTLIGMWLKFWAVVHCSAECAERLISYPKPKTWVR